MNWSRYQTDIFDWVTENRGENLVGEACAGSGKTTVLVETFNRLPKDINPLFLAFNKHIQVELSHKLPDNALCKTYHAAGLNVISQSLGRVKIDNEKVDYLLNDFLPRDQFKFLYYPIKRLVGLCKGNLLEPTIGNLDDLCFFHDIDTFDNSFRAYDAVTKIMQRSKENTSVVDFDDMCWLPVELQLKAETFDFVAVDEVQDTNACQIELAMLLKNGHTRVLGIGDRYQSIYGFRGADISAIPSLIERLQADQLPLSISYRAPKAVGELVNQTFPEIPFETCENAIDGLVANIPAKAFLTIVEPGDMILCRTNAPLVAPCLRLIRDGVKAQIVGRSIGKSLMTLLKKAEKATKFNSHDLNDVLIAMQEYCDNEIWKYMLRDHTAKAQVMQDKRDTIMALSDGCQSLSELYDRMDKIFSDEVVGVQFSTVHKAKGLEAPNVFILRPDLLPHPMAKQSWQKEQERNIKYVAYTRALKTLRFIIED